MFNLKLKSAALLTALLAGLLGASATRANSIEVSGVTTTQTGGVWDYAYSMSLTAGNSVSSTNVNGSSLFVFYDLIGLTGAQASFSPGTLNAADWNIVIENTTGVWANNESRIVSQGGTALETDLATLPNVRFQYVRPADFLSGGGNSAIGTAHIFSTAAPGLYGQFAARWVDNNQTSITTQINSQSIVLPTGTPAGAVVPVPAAVWTGLSTLAGMGLLFVSRRRARLA